jgi:hypothetical protein
VILHGIDFQRSEHEFATRDVDFLPRPQLPGHGHDGDSRSIETLRELCTARAHPREGPVALLHRIVDAMVDNYRR